MHHINSFLTYHHLVGLQRLAPAMDAGDPQHLNNISTSPDAYHRTLPTPAKETAMRVAKAEKIPNANTVF